MIGVSPTCCRNASDEVSASRSSRSTAPPTLTTAKRFASSCEKRLRYCEISFAPAIVESRRTMVCRVCLCAFMIDDPAVDDTDVAFGNSLQLEKFHKLVGRVRLPDIARAVDKRQVAGSREQRSFRPEVH